MNRWYAVEKPVVDLIWFCRFSSEHEEVLSYESGWTQLAKMKLLVAMALVYLNSTPEPAIPMVYSRSVYERQQIVRSEAE